MNASSSQAKAQYVPGHLPKTKPKITFLRLLCGLLVAFTLAAFVFWLFNIRQPGISYQRANELNLANSQTPLGDQTPADTQVSAQVVQDPQKTLTTEQILKKHVIHLATTIGERNLRTYDKLCEAADYIEAEYKSYGCLLYTSPSPRD